MEVIENLENLSGIWKNPIVAIGVFDGMHLGHQAILKKISSQAKKQGGTAILLSFHPHPQKIISPGDAPPLLQTTSQRVDLLEKLGIDVFIRLPFDRKLSLLTPDQFGEKILKTVGTREIYVGDNFKFGHERSGTYERLEDLGKKYGFTVYRTETQFFRDIRISSTRVRKAIIAGQVELAGRLLARPYEIEGMVVRGAGKGSTIGYPTANLDPANELVPPSGVYITRVTTNSGIYQGATNIGYRPTFQKNPDQGASIETHLIGFEDNLYGQKIKLSFCMRLREEKHFESIRALTDQIKHDLTRTRAYAVKTKSIMRKEQNFK